MFLSLVGDNAPLFAATSPEKQLEKGKALFEQEKNDEAMEYFIDVLLSGNRKQVAEANKYVNMIHNRVGGIQNPVEVDVAFKEGEVKRLSDAQTAAEAQAQQDMLLQRTAAADDITEASLEARTVANAVAEDSQAAAEDAKAIAQQTKDEVNAAKAQAKQDAAQVREDATAALEDAQVSAQTAAEETQASAQTVAEETQAVAQNTANDAAQTLAAAPVAVAQDNEDEDDDATAAATAATAQSSNSTYTDLVSPDALKARELYSQQKLDSMKAAVIERIRNTKGVRIYFRNDLPDAIDIDGDVIFQGTRFNLSAQPLLDDIYSLMALTQGASYIILPAGSYTDDVTLGGIRQAMALNSYFVHKGISSGKIGYNMGLYDQEPPAQFANLEGLSIVFDFDSDLPSAIAQANQISKQPLLSMAVVPVSNEIDPSKGEAFAVDFSVIETVNAVSNWTFQVVQHAKDGKYYVVRQLEGFAPVYHQILWNARKGIIGPELECGKYTLVLTVTDSTGEKKTLRRRITVKCGTQKAAVADEKSLCTKCNYKTARLWTKPGRVMMAPKAEKAEEPAAQTTDTVNVTGPTNKSTVNIYEETLPAGALDDASAAPMPTDPSAYGAPETTTTANPYDAPVAGTAADPYGTTANNNPYDMPYDQYDASSAQQ
ncbi:MAG: hypothetical protein PUK73_00290 [Spirochaetota bacterium]|uniref:hypothetical protein n=1 Tax=Candidatus Avelusimicrobium faecicola TaxID=3416205 RepID=UPI002A647792|nr:hypothetical protein [Spirochaetota bacterium]MDY6129301.1 hypothetical protein [Elusimicrobiaceae bacterium]